MLSRPSIPRLLTCAITLILLGTSTVAAGTSAKESDDQPSESDKPNEWVIAPIPVVEPNFGAGLGAVGLFLTPGMPLSSSCA